MVCKQSSTPLICCHLFIGVNIRQSAEKKKGTGLVSSRWICLAEPTKRCTSLACTSKCASHRVFLLKSLRIGSIIGKFCETCTWKRRSEEVFLYKRNLYNGLSVNQPAHKQKRPAFLRGVWSGKRDPNYIL